MGKKNGAEVVAPTTQAGNATTLKVVHSETDLANSTEKVDEGANPNEPKPKTVKDILDKTSRLNKCFQQLNSLDEAAKTLDSFNFGTSKIKDTLEISDGRGNSFETSNLFLIEKVVSTLKNSIAEKTTEIENEVFLLEAA